LRRRHERSPVIVSRLSSGNVLRLVVAVNVAGGIYGVFWYWDQLVATPALFWLVVPDCPLAALFVAAALTGVLLGWRSDVMCALAFACAVKYGIWTVAIIGHHWLVLGAPLGLENAVLLASHCGMMIEGFVYGLWVFRPRRTALLAPTIWFILNDSVDYIGGVFPTLPSPGQLPLAMGAAAATTFFALALFWWYCPRRKRASFAVEKTKRRAT